MPVDVLRGVVAAASVEEVVAAVQVWLVDRAPGGTAELRLADRGTRRLAALPGAAAASRAHEQGGVVVEAAADQWGVWVGLRGLAAPLGVLGLRGTGSLPDAIRRHAGGVGDVVALALDRLLCHVEVGLFRDAAEVVAKVREGGVVVASQEAELLYFSPGMERLTGWTADEVRARGFFECLYPDPVQRARAVVSTRESFSGNPATGVAWWFTHKDGTVVPCRLDSCRVTGADRRRYIVAHFGDRTPEEQRHVEAHHAELGRFAASVNHDFNNLLAVVHGHAEILRDHPDRAVQEHADRILTVGARAARLTRQLAAFGRDQPLFRSPADLPPLCEDVIRGFRAPNRPVVASSAAPDLPVCEIDPAAVRHLLQNLLENAGDAAGPAGRVRVELTVAHPPQDPTRGRGAAGQGWVRLRVTDDGPGFTEEARRKLFEPFYTSKGVGHGLGLAAVARIAEGLGAVVDVPRQIGRGAIVDVYLPVAARPPLPEATRRDPVAGGDEIVWLVDDDPAVLEVLALGLESFGYRVRCFEDGAAVLAAVDAGERVDLLVSDLVMPGLDGVGLYQGLRARGNGCAVLFVSGFAKTGVDVPQEPKTDFVSKPVKAKVLAEKARRLLNYVVPV